MEKFQRKKKQTSIGKTLQVITTCALLLPYPAYLISQDSDNQASLPIYAQQSALHGPVEFADSPVPSFHEDENSVKNATTTNSKSSQDHSITTSTQESLPHTSTPAIPSIDFAIHIPAIGLDHEIVMNVDAGDPQTYLPIIEQFVAHGAGTALPTATNGNIYLFAHSRTAPQGVTPHGGWFTRIDELTSGDSIILDYNGNRYNYSVVFSKIVDPSETDIYTGISVFDGNTSLALQTCYPRGTSTQRLIVYAIGLD